MYLEAIFLTIDVSCHLLLLSSASSPVPAMTLRNFKNLKVNTKLRTILHYLGSKHEDHSGGGAQLDPQEPEKIFHIRPAVWEKDNTKDKHLLSEVEWINSLTVWRPWCNWREQCCRYSRKSELPRQNRSWPCGHLYRLRFPTVEISIPLQWKIEIE